MEITISQNDNQLITISNNNEQNINIEQENNQLISLENNLNNQDINIKENENQVLYIDGGGNIVGISDVLVNGVSVVSNGIAYVITATKTSELENNSGFITNETDPTVPSYVKAISLADINNWNNKQDNLVSGSNIKTINNTSLLGSGNIEVGGANYSAGTGININSSNVISNTITSYNDLEDTPTIPTKVSDLSNDEDFVSANELSDVAFSGSYADLSNTPTIPDSTSDLINDSNFIDSTQLNTALSSKQDTLVSGTNIKTINNTSLLGSGNISVGGGTATDVQINGTSIVSNNVANIITESAYNSSTNKIATKNDIPTVNDGTLTIQKNGTTIDTFTANSSSNKTVNISIPTNYSDLTNDKNYVGYVLVDNNGWKVKKYDDGTFEAWYPFSNTSTTTATNNFATGLYNTGSITITGPTIARSVLDYRVNASFTTSYSWPIYWLINGTINLRYIIVANTNVSSATAYRQSAYMYGTWS